MGLLLHGESDARAGGSEVALKKKSMDMPPPNAVDAPFKKKATALEGPPLNGTV